MGDCTHPRSQGYTDEEGRSRCGGCGDVWSDELREWVGLEHKPFPMPLVMGATSEERTVTVRYRNHRGDVAVRRFIPHRVWFGATSWHPDPQWLIRAFDVDKQAERDFALADILGRPDGS
jgi:hypothetical protein